MKTKRGQSLLEGMMASAILLIGMVGISAMMVRGAGLSGDGSKMLKASSVANQQLTSLLQTGYEGLQAQVAAGTGYAQQYNTALEPAGVGGDVIYSLDASVQLVGDGGIVGVALITVSVAYRDWAQRDRTVVMSGIVSEKPDASF